MFISSIVQADCVVYWNTQPLDRPMQDPLFLMLSQMNTCPGSIQEIRTLFKNQRINEQISMVANRGRNNPEEGSFSFFESVYG